MRGAPVYRFRHPRSILRLHPLRIPKRFKLPHHAAFKHARQTPQFDCQPVVGEGAGQEFEVKMETKSLKLKDIIKHRDLQIRDQLDLNRVSFLEDVIEGWDPLLVYKVDSKYYLTDGFHRITAAERKQLENVNCQIVEGTFQDALIAAIKANSSHRGLPLTLKERHRAAELLLKTHTNWSNRRIAEIVGLSEHAVRLSRTELESKGIINTNEKRLGKDNIEQSSQKKVGNIPTETEISRKTPWDGKVECPKDALDVLKTEKRSFYDLILTDPPYNITEQANDHFADTEEYLNFMRGWLLLAMPLLKTSGRLYICFSYQHMLEALPIMREAVEVASKLYNFTFGCPIVWYHPNTISAAHNQKEYKPAYDFVFYWYGPDAPNLVADDAYMGDERANVWLLGNNVINAAVPQSNFHEGKFHKFQKPLELFERIIKGSTRAGDKVLDPFAGSGTTAVACVNLGRDYKIIEKDINCLEIIESRLKKVYGNYED